MDEVDPAVYELESTYMAEIQAILDGGTFADALAWVRDQEGVVEAGADDHQLAFRLEGGRPLFVIDPPVGEGGDTYDVRLASAQEPAADLHRPTLPYADVVGRETDRDNPQNRKRALFLEPYRFEMGQQFDEGMNALADIEDYSHDPGAIVHLVDELVTPAELATWRAYDAVFLQTHGGNINEWRWIASGIHQPAERSVNRYERCREYFGAHFTPTEIGVDCNYMTVAGEPSILLGVSTEFFQSVYRSSEAYPFEGLHKAIVYIGGCGVLRNDDMAQALAGSTTAFLSWDTFIRAGAGDIELAPERAARGLLRGLVDLRLPIGSVYEAMVRADLHRDLSQGSTLQLHDNGAESRLLRLYDLPTPRDSSAPTAVLEDGAELQIEGVAGDGVDDQLEIAVQVNGVIDPDATPSLDDSSPDGGGNANGGIVLATLHESESAADLYELRVYLDDELVATDNLGDPRQPEAEASQLDEGVYGYSATLSLPFDVEPDGMEVTLRLEVELPEGGVSDYEVDIVLVEAVGATVTIGGQTWTFRPAAFVGGCITSTGEQVVMSGHVDADVQQSSLWADLTPAGGEITVADSETGLNWMAAADRASMTVLHLVPDGHSQVDEIFFDDGRVWGTATFIETRAFVDAWNTNDAYPGPVQGTFEIRCPTNATD